MKWNKYQFRGRKVAGHAIVLAYSAEKVGGNCPPCPIGSAANG